MAEDLISNYINRETFAGDTSFAVDQMEILETAFLKLKAVRDSIQNSTSTKDIVGGVKEAADIIDNTTKSIADQTSTITQNTVAVKQNIQANTEQGVSLQQNIKTLNDYKSALADNVASQKQAKADAESGKISAEDYRQKITQLTEAQFQYKQQIAEVSKNIKTQTISNLGLQDSYQQLSAEYNKAAQAAKNLAVQARISPEFAAQAQEAALKAKGLSDVLKTIDSSVGQFQRNVGNYTGAVGILQKGFTEAKAQLDQMSESERNNTAAGQQLTKQVEILASFSQQQSEGFRSLTTELRNSERALRTMYEAGLAGTPVFEELQTVVNNTTRQVREFGREQTLLSSESPALAGLTAAARGLGGAYAIGAGAAALFADGNEKVEKELNKLVAIMTLLQGLTEFNRFLQEKESIAKSLNGIKTLFLAAAQKLVAVATGDATKATIAQAEAQKAAVVSSAELAQTQGTVAEGNEAIALSGGEAALGLEAESGAVDSLAVGLNTAAESELAVVAGATAMETAIAATGIGLLIIGLSVAIYKIVEAIKDWNAASDSIKKANDDVVKSLRDLIDATKAFDDANRVSTTNRLDALDREIAAQKAKGVTVLEGMRLDKEAADAKAKFAQEEVNQNSLTQVSVDKKLADMQNDAANVKAAEELKQKYIAKTGDKTKEIYEAQELSRKIASGQVPLSMDAVEKLKVLGDKDYVDKIAQFDAVIKKGKEQADLSAADYKSDSEKFTASETTKQQALLVTTGIEVTSAADRRKLILESATIESGIITAKNSAVLNDEKSTLAQRLLALRSSLEEQKRIIIANNTAIQNDPTASNVDKILSAKKANAEILAANNEENVNEYKQKEDYRIKNLNAVTETQKSILDVIVQTNAEIYNNDALTEAQRLEALKDSVAARKTIIESQFDATLSSSGISDANIERIKKEGFFEIANKKITDDELLKLISDYNLSEVALTKDSATQRIKIVKDFYQQEIDENAKALKKLQLDNDAVTEDRADSYTNDVIALNDAYAKKLINQKHYTEQRKDLDDKYNKGSLNDQIDSIQKLLDLNQVNIDAQKKGQAELKELKAQDTSGMTLEEKSAHDEKIKQVTDELKTTEGAVKQQITLYSNLHKAKKAASDSDHKDDADKQSDKNKLAEEELKSVLAVQNAITGLVDVGYQKQIAAIQKIIDLNNIRKDEEIKSISQSSLSNQEKAAQLIILDNTVAANNRRLQREQVAIQIKQAKFDRDSAILGITENAAVAIMAALKIPVYGEAEAIAIGITAASQIAMLLAKPLPTMPAFKHGKNDDYAGHAIVGDGGVPEYIRREDGTIEKTPAYDTLTTLSKNDIVYPNWQSLVRSLAMPELIISNSGSANDGLIIAAIHSGARMTVNAMKKQKGTNVNIKVDGYWGAYITKSVRE